MKGLVEIELRALAFSKHSSTPKPLGIFTGKAIENAPASAVPVATRLEDFE